MDIREVPIADIIVRRDRAKPKEEEVILLAGSIEEIGLQQPITINVVQDREAGSEEPDGLLLVFGGHRLEACKRLGWTTIPANILTVNEIDAELIEIDENLRRRVLDQLETGALLKRRQELYESRHPETRRGVIGGKSGGRGREKIASANVALAIPAQTASFTQDVAQKTGRSVRSVQCDIAIAKAIPDDVRDVLVDTPIANNKSELKKLGKLDPKHKKAAAKAIASGKAKTVAEATKVLAADAPLPRNQEDENGVEVPSELLDVFEGRAEYNRLARKGMQLASEVKALGVTAAGHYIDDDCGFGQCVETLLGAKPHSLADNEVGYLPARNFV